MNLLCCLVVTLSLFHFSKTQDDKLDANSTQVTIKPDQIRVFLYTRLNTTNPDLDIPINDTEPLTNSLYNASNSLVVIIHGFKGSANESSFLNIKDAYLGRGGWNVMLLDWSPLSKVDKYLTAVQNADHVGQWFAEFFNEMISKNLTDSTTTHLVGFSIGSHIAGLIGKRVNGTLAKIFALDPAYPLYYRRNSNDRLDVNDAEFVQVIHTSGNFISFEDSVGHVDFYPNSGKLPQPLCLHSNRGTAGMEFISVMLCSHKISVHYFAESVMYENYFMAKQCPSWSDFSNKTCNSEEIPMGYATPISARGNYYLNIVRLHNYQDNEIR